MKKLLLAAIVPLALASCNLNGVPKSDVTGSISNAPTDQGTIRMAVIGVTVGGLTNDYVNQVAVVPDTKGLYSVTLPASPKVGGYEVIAYADKNENKVYDAGETRTQSNGKTIVYSDGSALASFVGLSQGWNLVENLKVTSTTLPFTAYNLTF